MCVYALNEKQHWIFRIYDAWNEAWARLWFQGVRQRAADFGHELPGCAPDVRMRLLVPSDLEKFAELLARFDFRYLPPHPLDRAAAEKALRRRSYLPFGIFVSETLVGYALLRIFFPRRVVSGIWVLSRYHGTGIALAAIHATGEFTRAERLPDYVTIPLDNEPSLMGAQAAGWRITHSNRRFHVLRR